MGRLTSTVTNRIEENRRKRTEIPEWTPKLGMLGLGLMVAFMIFRGVTQEPAPEPVAPGAEVVVPSGNGSSTDPFAASTTTQPATMTTEPAAPDTTTTVAADTVDLPLESGGTAAVDRNAVRIAERAAVASLTGNWDGVPVAPSAVKTVPATPAPSADAVDVTAVDVTPVRAALVVAVAVDPANPSATQFVAITVVRVADGWAFLS